MTFRKVIFLVLLFPLAGYCHEGVIKGFVKDPQTRLPLAGASVVLEGKAKRVTFTDQFGLYKFTSLHSEVIPLQYRTLATKKLSFKRSLKTKK